MNESGDRKKKENKARGERKTESRGGLAQGLRRSSVSGYWKVLFMAIFYLVFISAASGFDEGICEIVCVAVRFMELGHIIPSIRPKSLHFSFPFLSRTMGF